MGVKLTRAKPRSLLVAILYRLLKFPLISNRTKFKLFLDLEWIFDRLAHEISFKIYPAQDHPFRSQARSFLLKFIQPDHTVLDLGCGMGHVTDIIASRASKVVGVDHDTQAIQTAGSAYRRENLTFLCGDALEYLRGSREKFDVLVLSHILEHLDDPEAFLRTFLGRFDYIYIEVPDFDRAYANWYRKDLNAALIYSDNDHIHEFDRYELTELLSRCNVRVVEAEYRFGLMRLWCKVQKKV